MAKNTDIGSRSTCCVAYRVCPRARAPALARPVGPASCTVSVRSGMPSTEPKGPSACSRSASPAGAGARCSPVPGSRPARARPDPGSHWNRRRARTAPTIPQAAITARSPQLGVVASTYGLKPAAAGSTKCLSGKKVATRSIHAGSSVKPKIPEMNDSRISDALAKPWAELGVGAIAATASPSAEKHAIPTANVRTRAGMFAQITWTP